MLLSDMVFADWALIDQRGRSLQGNTVPVLRAVSLYGHVAVCVVYISSSLSLDAQLCNKCFGRVGRLR